MKRPAVGLGLNPLFPYQNRTFSALFSFHSLAIHKFPHLRTQLSVRASAKSTVATATTTKKLLMPFDSWQL